MKEEFKELDIPRPNKLTPTSWYVSEGVGSGLCLTTTTGTVEDIHTFADEGCFEEVFWFNGELDAMEALAKYYLKHQVDFPYHVEWLALTIADFPEQKNSVSEVMDFI